ncbi:MAG: SAM hydrolase/SAM-dependent halogenase family protein [Bacteroidales bacterium]
MHIITLTSDWNENDYYVASIKGKLLTACPEARIVDISHQVRPFNTAQAAFVVRNSYPSFPENTIHIIAVNSEPEKGGQWLAARINQQFFLCADNGLLGLLGDPEPEIVVRLNDSEESEPVTFVARQLFARTACALARGVPITDLGTPITEYNRQTPLRPTLEDHTITGSVIYIDSYKNAITNISRELFDRIGNGRKFQIFVQSKHYMLDKINRRYNESPPGELLAVFNTAGLLEIAIRNGNAAGLLKLNTNSTIRVEFKEG